jgi:type III restriction enzyme
MKIQFNPDLDYQAEAVVSIVAIFEGQETCQTSFTVAPLKQQNGLFAAQDQSDLGIGNRLRLLDDEILANVQTIQLRNGLAQSAALDGMNFTIEMETGTGKTYPQFTNYRRGLGGKAGWTGLSALWSV